MISAIISRLVILAFGTLYPAYSSYKAVRTKNVKEYVKWMMYWIVFAFFTFIETFTDIFLSWFPFYYEVKVIIVVWLLSPATKGSSTLYRKFVHPMLTRKEQEIDEYLNQAKEKGYTTFIQLGSKGVNYATNVLMQTALKGGGNLVQSIRRSYSLSDLSEPDIQRTQDEIDEVIKPQRFLRAKNQSMRSSSGSRHSEMYFSEVDVGGSKAPVPNYNYIRSTEDISSGYSSAEPVSGGLSRTSSMTNTTRPRFKAKRAEEGRYLNISEYEAMREFPVIPFTYPQILFYRNHHQLSSSLSVPVDTETIESLDTSRSTLNELKDEIFLENEVFFQNSKRQEINGRELNNSIPKEMKEKYEMFCKWLELTGKQSEVPGKSVEKQNSEDDFRDTMSEGSGEEDETFVDSESNVEEVEDNKIEKEQEPSKQDSCAKVKVEQRSSDNLSGRDENPDSNKPDLSDSHKNLEALLESLCKKPVQHTKGKAPDPPEPTQKSPEKYPTPLPPPSLPKMMVDSEVVTSTSSKSSQCTSVESKPLCVPDSQLNYSSNQCELSPSRSPSPSPSKSSEHKKTKKSIFKNYLPSLFRSESPKSNNVNPSQSFPSSNPDEFHKETQI